jgi:hypothetical protein
MIDYQRIKRFCTNLKYPSFPALHEKMAETADKSNAPTLEKLLSLSRFYRDDYLQVAFCASVRDNNPASFNDALAAYANWSFHLFGQTRDGTGGQSAFVHVLEALAGHNLTIAKRFYADKDYYTKGTAWNKTINNSLICLLNKNGDESDIVLSQIEDALTKKNSKIQVAILAYIRCLFLKMAESASQYLENACKFYLKANWIHDFKNPVLKYIGLIPHGLYELARVHLPAERFQELQLPEYPFIWQELAGIGNQGKITIQFTGSLTPLNTILEK